MEVKIRRILCNIDRLINRNYNFNELAVVELANRYMCLYVEKLEENVSFSELVVLCNVCYVLALKFLLDRPPRLNDYSNIVSVDKRLLKEKELEVLFGLDFKLNLSIG